MTYRELLERLYAARRAGIVLGLARVEQVLERLGRPHDRLGKIIHVAGTNGKGSTVAIAVALARASGAKVGSYTSPHLMSLRERIDVGNGPIDEATLLDAATQAHTAGADALTFFEQITVIAFVALANAQLDVTVVEVGLGGRLDATNVVAADVAVVTGVALDHQEMLGDTLAEIAGEKAGIFKPGQHIVLGASGERGAMPTLLAAAKAVNPWSLTVIDEAEQAEVPTGLSLFGAHQVGNAAVAIAAVRHIVTLTPRQIAEALATVRHPGRLELVAESPTVFLDGAHNPHGAAALAQSMSTMRRPRVLVLAVSADKDVLGIVGPLLAEAEVMVATSYAQPRAMHSDKLAELARQLHPHVLAAANLVDAVARAKLSATSKGTVIVAGSLMLVGEARALWCDGPVDPLVVSDPGPPSANP